MRLQVLVQEDELESDHADGRVADGPPRSSAALSSNLLVALRRVGLRCQNSWHAMRSDIATRQLSSADPAASQSRAGNFADGLHCASESVAAPRSCSPPAG